MCIISVRCRTYRQSGRYDDFDAKTYTCIPSINTLLTPRQLRTNIPTQLRRTDNIIRRDFIIALRRCTIKNRTLVISQDVRVLPDSIKQLPLQLNDTVIYYENELLMVESERGLSLICNMNFQYCTFHISGIHIKKILLSKFTV